MKYIGGNGLVVAIDSDGGRVIWQTELKTGWFKLGASFVSLTEDGQFLYAFSYGKLYKLNKNSGKIILESEVVKKLKHLTGVFSSTGPDQQSIAASLYSTSSNDGGDSGDGGD